MQWNLIRGAKVCVINPLSGTRMRKLIHITESYDTGKSGTDFLPKQRRHVKRDPRLGLQSSMFKGLVDESSTNCQQKCQQALTNGECRRSSG
jgi:hypothetical protein